MLRKFLTQVFLFLLLFSIWWRFEYQDYIATSGKISNTIPAFPSLQAEMLKSSNRQDATSALEEIARTLINYLEPELAKETWDCSFLFADLLPGEADELVLTLSLPPDRGVLVLLQQQKNHYVLLYYLDNLLPLTKMDKIALPDGREILSTREEHQERTGAFSESRLIKLWTWKNNTLQVVWSDMSYWETNWLSTWQDPNSQELKWYKLIQEAGITYQVEPRPSVIIQGRQSYYQCPTDKVTLPSQEKFSLIKQRDIKEVYYWSDEWQRFTIGTATIPAQNDQPAQKVCILKDMENHLESLADNQQAYEVIGPDGRIFLVEKSRVKLSS